MRAPAGTFAHLPGGTVHGFRIESETARYLIRTTPRHGRFYRAIRLRRCLVACLHSNRSRDRRSNRRAATTASSSSGRCRIQANSCSLPSLRLRRPLRHAIDSLLMRSTRGLGVIALVAAIACPRAAVAAPITECGNYGWIEGQGRTGWTYGRIDGAGIFNVTTRRVGCRYARRFVRSWEGQVGARRHRGFKCRYVSQAHEYADVRCTRRGAKVIRWQTGA